MAWMCCTVVPRDPAAATACGRMGSLTTCTRRPAKRPPSRRAAGPWCRWRALAGAYMPSLVPWQQTRQDKGETYRVKPEHHDPPNLAELVEPQTAPPPTKPPPHPHLRLVVPLRHPAAPGQAGVHPLVGHHPAAVRQAQQVLHAAGRRRRVQGGGGRGGLGLAGSMPWGNQREAGEALAHPATAWVEASGTLNPTQLSSGSPAPLHDAAVIHRDQDMGGVPAGRCMCREGACSA